ncbi:MAG: hypothetical protein ACKOWD_04040 [Rhodoferax sp.]
MKAALMCLVLLVSGCAGVTPQSIYEGLRTQQSLKNAGTMPPADKLDPYDAYEKQRDTLKPAQ